MPSSTPATTAAAPASAAQSASSAQQQTIHRPFVPTKPVEQLLKLKNTAGALPYDNEAVGVYGDQSVWKKIISRGYVTLYSGKMSSVVLLSSTISDTVPVWCKEVHLGRCPPRYRQNLVVNATSIMRFLLKSKSNTVCCQ